MDEYFAEDNILLFNKLGIEDKDDLIRAEEEIVAARMAELIENPAGNNFDFEMLGKFIRNCFPISMILPAKYGM